MKAAPQKFILMLIVSAVLLRTVFSVLAADFTELNPDEKMHFRIAARSIEDSVNASDRRVVRSKSIFLVSLYTCWLKNGLSEKSWAVLINSVSLLLFGFSIAIFFRLCGLLTRSVKLDLFATAVYAFYPSNVYHIGRLFNYEKMVLPLLIFVTYELATIILGRTEKAGPRSLILVPLCVVLSCLFRPHLILIYFGMFALYLVILIREKPLSLRKNLVLPAVVASSMILSHIPLIAAHYGIYGRFGFDSRLGQGLIQGHNPYARGSWEGRGNQPENEYFKFRKQLIPDMGDLNKNELDRRYGRVALDWIFSHPKEEVILILRKLAIFFLPRNYEGGFNPVTAVVHLFFFLSVLRLLMVFRERENIDLFILSPVLFTILFCLIFFVGYRWRYYAEPFMILFSLLTIGRILNRTSSRPDVHIRSKEANEE